MNVGSNCCLEYKDMIVVKEEQGAGEWVRNGGSDSSDPTGSYGRSTMLKEDMPPNLPPDHHNMPHNNNGHNGNPNSNNNNNSPTLGNHNHHGTSGITGVANCGNSGQGHPHGQNNNNANCNNNNSGGGGGSGNNICSGCGIRILDRFYVLAVDRQWHNECLKCHSCGVVLSNQLTCFARDGLILCKEDYYRTYQQIPRRACARCGNGIGSHELIMRAKDLVYHLHCFICVVCSHVLNKGDHFGMRNSALYCQKHFEMHLDDNSASSPPPPHLPPNSPHGHHHNAHHHTPPHQPAHPGSAFFNGAGSGQKGRPRKRKDPSVVDGNMGSIIELGATTPPAMQHLTQNLDLLAGEPGSGHHLSGPRLEGYDSSSSTSCPTGVTGQQRTKRMRTSFKHHQLRTMKSYFAINQNPDAKDLKQLAQRTGLSKRVLQVWFQNARAKWRRNMLRTESSKSGGTTPTRDDDQMNSSSIASGALDILSGGGGSDDGGFSSDVY